MRFNMFATTLCAYGLFTSAVFADSVTFDDVNNERFTIEYDEYTDSEGSFYEILGMKAGEMDSQEPRNPIYVGFDSGFDATDIICSFINSEWSGDGFATTTPTDDEAMGFDFSVDSETGKVMSTYTAATSLSYYGQTDGYVVMKYAFCE